jgi:hypothetical protein
VVIPDTPTVRQVCFARGAPDVFTLDESPATRVGVRPGRRSVVLYSDLLHETYCGAIADVELLDGEVEVRVSASRDRFAPAFVLRNAAGQELGRFDLDGMSGGELQHWVEGDGEWMPVTVTRLESAFLTRPLEVGDFVEWRADGGHRRGKVVSIRDVSTNLPVERIAGFDPRPYAIRAAREERGVVALGQITPAHWRIGDVRLA